MVNISKGEFSSAVTSCGYPSPSGDKYDGFMSSLSLAGISTKREAAMFLAQLIHESGGFQHKEEIAYKGCTSSNYDTSVGVRGKSYHGRGYIQLTHSYNYLAASKYIFGDDRLISNPERVCQSEELAFKTAAWYWKTNVGTRSGVKNGRFGCSTGAINGAIESEGRENPNRFRYYCNVMQAFGVRETPDSSW